MFQKAVNKADIVQGDMWGGMVDGIYIVVYALPSGEFVATEGYCTHEKCMLNFGYLMGEEVECACHGGRFHVRTGQATGAPAETPLWVFDVEVRGDDIYVDI